MSLSPTGSLSLALSRARQIVAGSSTFQAVVEADDETAALASVFYHSVEDEDTVRPFAVVRMMNDEDVQRISSTGFQCDGMMVVEFHFDIPAEYTDFSDKYIWLLNQIGQIKDEILTLARNPNQTNNYLAVQSMTQGPLGIVDPVEVREQSIGVSSWLMSARIST